MEDGGWGFGRRRSEAQHPIPKTLLGNALAKLQIADFLGDYQLMVEHRSAQVGD
jgi:hypothetical protein